MSEHTSGPWASGHLAAPEGVTQVEVYREDTGKRIAYVFDSDADARLIAAAPDLLSACKAARVLLNDTDYEHEIEVLRVAIAKAE